METNVKFDFDGYTIIADGVVLSPGDVRDLDLTVEGMDLTEIDLDVLTVMVQVAEEHLVTKAYEGEMEF